MRFANSFQVDECTIPEGMTLGEWRRSQSRPRRTWRRRMRRVARRPGRPHGAGTSIR